MRAPLHARHQLATRAPAVTRRKNRSRRRQTASTTVTSSASSSSIVPSLRRAIRVDDRELFRRARRVQRWQDLSRSSDDHTPANLATQGWQWRRQKKGFKLYTRQSPMVNAPIGSQSFSSLLDSEILAVGNVACSISQLAPPLRSPSESESRTYTTDAEETEDRSNQLLVKTCAYVHTSLFEKKNEQLCYAELFSPTVSGGFRITTCSLAGREVIAGKVRAPLSRALHQLHPFSAWLSAEPARSGVHVVFRARFHRSESDGSYSSKVMNARLWKLAKGMCRLGKLVDNSVHHARGLSSSCMNHTVSGGPRNSRCIVCTRTMFRIFMLRSCCRCELCSYNVCHACCSNQHVAIYNRHVAPLLVCDRCRESLARNEFDSQLRAVNPKSCEQPFR
ncbi:hypothetical protein PI124_g19079 [Phytophthora idaei]|nr:hypothetical protein PI126_g18449 [Phytophthora idaei]KAG3235899.1 hypothetical protein PI124_g19079 [Phytophthora idaei]